MSDVTPSLRELLKPDHREWNDEHNEQFQTLKRLITAQPDRVLQYFKYNDSVYIQADASKYGSGAVSLQNSGPFQCASRALTPTEQNYSQIEKEMLAVDFRCLKFHQ